MTSPRHTDTDTDTNNHTYTRRRYLAQAGTLAATAFAGTGMTSADTGRGGFDSVFGFEMDVEPDTWAFIRGYLGGFTGIAAPPPVETLADRARNEFEANEEHWLSYGNWLIDEHDAEPIDSATVAVDFTITRLGWPTATGTAETALYVDFDSGAQVVDSIDWRVETADDPDFEVELRNRAAERAADELQAFRREWIDDDGDSHELPTDEYLSELAGSYWSSVRLDSDSRSILDVLLGEVRP